MNKKADEFVNVSVRIKPTNSPETSIQIINKQPAILHVSDRTETYHFDKVFSAEANQEDVYNETVSNLVENVKAGFNCTVFAYGQTGTGKTYTIGTNPHITNDEESGLIVRTLNDFFKENDDIDMYISISFIEIYNEKVFDLLSASTNRPLPVKGFLVQGFEKVQITSTLDAVAHLQIGSRRRHIGETKRNISSSRSHAIFSIHCHTRNIEHETLAKLNLVDLAGSERACKTGTQGSSFFEGVNINKALLSLGQVMTALTTNSTHIPYRQSVLTTILQDSLNKKNYVSLIACISPTLEDIGETLQTLEFANRVKKMKNKPEVNNFLSQYRRENPSWVKGFAANKRLYETPFKRTKSVLPIIQEPVSNFDSPLLSSSLISVASSTPHNFSPVIKKYITAMESSILTRVEDVIKRTLRKRKSSFLDNFKENSVEGSSKTRKRLAEDVRLALEDISLLSSDNSFNSSLNNSDLMNNSVKDDDFVFKKPNLPIVNTKNSGPRRSSMRLQMKNRSPGLPQVDTNRRRSVRLQVKNLAKAEEECNTKQEICHCKCATKKDGRVKKSKEVASESPTASRTKFVLNVLNNGSLRDLEKLHTIGAKTAEKIKLFREMRGPFKTVLDIAEIPYFSKKKYEQFLAENFLK